MAFGDQLARLLRGPLGRFRRPRAAERPTPQPLAPRGELAFADPRRLFPGNQPFQTYNPSTLVGSKGLAVFDEMRRDDQVKSALAFKKYACLSTGWQVQSPEGQPPDWEPTLFARWVLNNLDPLEIGGPTLDQDLYCILSALDYGYSVTEKIWAPIDEGPWEGHVGLKSLKTRAPHYLTFAQDQYGNLEPDGIVQMTGTSNDARLPRSKFVLYSYQSQFDNPYGTSDLEAAYTPWWIKYNSQKWLAMLLERLGIPPIFGLYNPAAYQGGTPGSTLAADLKKIMSNLQAATFGIIPRPNKEALEFWAPELADNATRVFLPSLEYLNKGIARSILMPDLLGMTADTSQGSYARAEVHFDVFLLVVEAIRRDMAIPVMQHQVMKPLLDINFPGLKEYPIWSFLPLTDNLRLEILKEWRALVTQGVVTNSATDEVYVRKMIKFPEKEDPLEDPPSEELLEAQMAKLRATNGNGAGGNGGGGGGGRPANPFVASPDSRSYYDPSQPRDPAGSSTGGQWSSEGGGAPGGTGTATATATGGKVAERDQKKLRDAGRVPYPAGDNTHDFGPPEGPVWTGPVAHSGLTAQFTSAKYQEWEDEKGFGPCGVMSVINREDKGWQIARVNATPADREPSFRHTFPHFVNIGPSGEIIDHTNPFDKPLRYQGVTLLYPDELPDLVSKKDVHDLRILMK